MKLSEEHISRAIYFYGEINGDIKLNPELSQFEWFDIDDPKIFDLNFAFNQKEVLKDFVDFWSKV